MFHGGDLRINHPQNVPSKLFVHGNATATVHNLVASEMLFRLGIADRAHLSGRFYLRRLGFLPSAQRRQSAARLAHGDIARCLGSDSVYK